jgi:hypothetical protein
MPKKAAKGQFVVVAGPESALLPNQADGSGMAREGPRARETMAVGAQRPDSSVPRRDHGSIPRLYARIHAPVPFSIEGEGFYKRIDRPDGASAGVWIINDPFLTRGLNR